MEDPISVWDNELPAENIENTIEDMLDGDIGWTVPWALSYIRGSWYINKGYMLEPEMIGDTLKLLVIRDKEQYYTILFWLNYKFDSGESWPKEQCFPCNFVRYDKITEQQIQSFSPDVRTQIEVLLR